MAPAAVRNHHAYRHGLLEHSLIVAETAAGVAARFDAVDRSLVVAGALLHDIGKTHAYTSDGMAPLMSDVGKLHGEIVIGHDMVRELIAEVPGFPAGLSTCLRHIIIAHHGAREKGSPVVPQTREAVIVHYCDDMTARIGAIDDAQRCLAPRRSVVGAHRHARDVGLLRAAGRRRPGPVVNGGRPGRRDAPGRPPLFFSPRARRRRPAPAAAWPLGVTFGYTLRSVPSGSMSQVVRLATPTMGRATPKAAATA